MLQRKTNWNHERYTRQWQGTHYEGYPIIYRDHPVEGGVYYRGLPEEAITVDPGTDPTLYRNLEYSALEAALELGVLNRRNVLRAVFETVAQRITYSRPGVQETLHREAARRGQSTLPRGSLVDLSAHLRAGQGVCRHQALASGWLLERFIARGELAGAFSVDNNEIVSPQRELDGHVWARHTEPVSEPCTGVTILDVAQNFMGSLGESFEGARWNYGRPDELHLPGNILDPALVQT